MTSKKFMTIGMMMPTKVMNLLTYITAGVITTDNSSPDHASVNLISNVDLASSSVILLFPPVSKDFSG